MGGGIGGGTGLFAGGGGGGGSREDCEGGGKGDGLAGAALRNWKTVPQRGQLTAATPLMASDAKTCVQVGLGQGKPFSMADSARECGLIF